MADTEIEQLQSLLLQLDQLDEIFGKQKTQVLIYLKKKDGIKRLAIRILTVIGCCLPSCWAWILRIHKKIKVQRTIVGEIRVLIHEILQKEGSDFSHYLSNDELERLKENVRWAKKFGLSNSQCAEVLGEKTEAIKSILKKK